ncbi:50S ribosomal protein L11 methyltransferase [Denitratisoma sp. DHT3]|uniref:50S ribosomal protein L11 methyltransferase n=1 Tax=Denitratisoma sp. DHT3 TaxID=1981880 RepID=UPI0011988D94|nr:50S ribosomal protein L11 methyltransferase [Denitratisoma sp. DHT3]QDX82087.1 50S ribosomal protein L11 methyltransferase [Denitratisoma sp. DHT3]
MWINVTVPVEAAHAEPLSDALMEQGALSVSVEDAFLGTEQETPQFGEPGSPTTPLWEHSRVTALFEPGDDLPGRVAAACQAIGLADLPEFEFAEVAEQNWVQLTQSQFEPIRINDRFWIVPSWHMEQFQQTPAADRIVLQLDPGLAFGTGSHPTTWLCLQWLCEQVQGGETLLDYGCGSGILAIAAAKLGAASVLGVDIDEKALEAAAENARRNGVDLALRHSRQPLAERFDLVVANILTNPLCVLAPLLSDRLAPGGRLALSGVLETQASQVIEAYAPYLRLEPGAVHEGWCRLEGRRR